MNITGARLLDIEEYKKFFKKIPKFRALWWLRSTGFGGGLAAFVCYDGSVRYCGDYVNRIDDCVRPALEISNLRSSDPKVGNEFVFGCKRFTIISRSLAICNDCIGVHRFDSKSNDYEKSEVKAYIDEWFSLALQAQRNEDELARMKSVSPIAD